MNAKAPQTADELKALDGKPPLSTPPPPREELHELRQMVPKPSFPPDIQKPQGFIVRVPLVCPHCSSYMRVLPSGTVMTCHSERCPNHLKKFRLPVLYAEEVKE